MPQPQFQIPGIEEVDQNDLPSYVPDIEEEPQPETDEPSVPNKSEEVSEEPNKETNNEEDPSEQNQENQENQEEVVSDNIATTLNELTGYNIEGDFGNSPEDVAKYIHEVGKQRDQQTLNNFMASNPELARFYKHHIVDQKPIETFIERTVQPSAITTKLEPIDSSTPEDQKLDIEESYYNVISESYKKKGLDKQEIDTIFKNSKDKYALAQKEQRWLQKNYEDQIRYKEEQEAQQRQREIQEEQELHREINESFEKNDFDGFSIPEAKLDQFKRYLLTPVKDGMTQADLDWDKLSTGKKLYLDYVVMNQFNNLGVSRKSNKNNKFINVKKENDSRTGVPRGSQSQGNTDFESVKETFKKSKGFNHFVN